MRIIASVAFDTVHGLRSLQIVHGGIEEADDGTVVVSTHANPSIALEGAGLRALERRWDVLIDAATLDPLLRLGATPLGTYRATPETSRPRRILVVRLPGALSLSRQGGDPKEILGRGLWTLFGSLAALELEEDAMADGSRRRSMAMTVLGGSRGHHPENLSELLVKHVRGWLELSRYMDRVRVFIPVLEEASALGEQLHTLLGMTPLEAGKSQVLEALISEALTTMKEIQNARVASVAVELRDWLKPRRFVVRVVAGDGRRLVEAMVEEMLRDAKLDTKGPLHEQLARLSSKQVIAHWTFAYFQALRQFGNESVHARGEGAPPGRFGEQDVVALLAALQRVLAIWVTVEAQRPGLRR